MKKILFAMMFCLLALSVRAEVLKAKAVDEISTTNPTEYISVRLVRDFALDKETTLKKDYILTGKMTDIVDPEKWHHNGSFTFIPTSYKDTDGNIHKIEKEIKATYRQKIKPVAREWGVGVGDFYFSPSYIDSTKIIVNGEGKEVFDEYCDKTTHWGKGVPVDILPDEVIYFNFPD